MITLKTKIFLLTFVIVGSLGLFLVYAAPKNELSGDELKVEEMLQAGDFDATKIIVKYKQEHYDSEKYKETLGIEQVDILQNQSDTQGEAYYIAESAEEIEYVRLKILEYMSKPEIEFAEPNYIRTALSWTVGATTAKPDDFDDTKHWYYVDGKLPEMWKGQDCPTGEFCGSTSDILVAVIDTGLAFESYDDTGATGFAEQELGVSGGVNYTAISPEYNTANGFTLYENPVEAAFGYNGKDDDCNGWIDDIHGFDIYARESLSFDVQTCDEETNTIPVDFSGTPDKYLLKQGHPVDTQGHGSLVTGLISGVVDDGGDIVSPAFNVTILPISANQHFTLTYDDLMINTAMAEIVNQGIPVDIINLDIGSHAYSGALETRINQLVVEEDITIISPSGNDSTSGSLQPVTYPAAYDNVIAVGAINHDTSRSEYSNGGSNLDLVAYVGEVDASGTAVYQSTLSCYPCTSTDSFSSTAATTAIGTSFAAPQATAAAAVILVNNPGISPSLVKAALIDTATDVGTVGFDNDTGYGSLNFPDAQDFIVRYAYYPFYATSTLHNSQEWLLVGNPSSTEQVNIDIDIGETISDSQSIDSNGIFIGKYSAFDGPVTITADDFIYTTKRTVLNGSFNEFAGISDDDIKLQHYYPFYATSTASGSQDWILVGNPSVDTSANVNIKIGSSVNQFYTLAPGEKITPKYVDVVDGPVEISSNNPVYSTKRSVINGSFNEMTSIHDSYISDEHFYPFYATDSSLGSQDWILVGNPSVSTSANVNIKIGTSIDEDFVLAPGEKITPKWNVVDNPVVVTSDIDVYSTKRTVFDGSFNENKGITSVNIDTSFFYPFYSTNKTSGSQDWILVGNPSVDTSANVNIKIGTSVDENYVIPPGESIFPKWGITDSPVEVTSDIPIYSTKRTLLNGSFNEIIGL